jgi:hypothetical protein
VLDLVDAVEENGGERRRILPLEHPDDPKPVALAPRIEADPLRELFRPAALDRLRLGRQIERERLLIEVRDGLDAVVKALGPAAEPKLPPWHPAGHDVPLDGRRREREREIQDRRPQSGAIQDRPQGLRLHVVCGRDVEVVALGRILGEEVEHSVVSRTPSGDERGPGGRGQRRDHRSQVRAHGRCQEAPKRRHDSLLHQRVEDVERRPVEPD